MDRTVHTARFVGGCLFCGEGMVWSDCECVCVCVCVCMQMCVSVQTALAYNYNTSSSKGGLGVPLVSGLMVLPLTNVFELESVLEKAATNSSKTWAACSWSTFFGGGGECRK